jgi:prophage tail gpP-like protein
MASEEYVTLEVGGFAWSAWTRVAISYSAKQAVRSFAVTVTDESNEPWGQQWEFMPGTEVSVKAGGDLVLKGYIDRMSPSYEANAHKVEISGRSKAADAVDSSAEHETGEFRDKSILEVARALDKQSVGFSCDFTPPKVPLFRVNPGETVFAAIERISRKQQLLLVGQPDGSVKIEKGGSKRVHAPLLEGVNILGASAVFDASDKHSEYKVKGQRPFGSAKKDALQIEAKAEDKSVKRYRPKVLIGEADGSEEDAKKRAENHRDRQMGESVSASVRVQGWRCDNGILWQPNTLVFVSSPMLKLNMDMLIESVQLTQDNSGTFTQLSLVHPKALGSEAKPGSKADKAWTEATTGMDLPQPASFQNVIDSGRQGLDANGIGNIGGMGGGLNSFGLGGPRTS